MRRKKVKWQAHDVFAIPLMNGKYAIGHVLDQRMVNAVRVALYDEVIEDLNIINLDIMISDNNLISLIEVWRDKLDYGSWEIIGNKPTIIPIDKFANEQFRSNKWINSVTYDGGLAEDFLNSFYGFLPWNDWYDPNYLDEYLVDPSKKPTNLLYKKTE